MKAFILVFLITMFSTGTVLARDRNIEQGDHILKTCGNSQDMLRAQAYYLRSIAQSLNLLINAPNENERARLGVKDESEDIRR